MQFIYTPTAQEHFKRLPPEIRKRVAAKMRFYADQPDPLVFAERLADRARYRFRVGDYRLIFEFQNAAVWVLAIRRRDEAYR